MPVIKLNDQQFSLRPGPNRLGAGADADVCVIDDDALGVQAIVDLAGNDNAVIRRVGDDKAPGRPTVRVNGIPLVDPTPLIHGDKVEIGGRELLYADDTKVGATQYVSAAAIAAIAQKRPGAGGRATTATGGRLVSLVDGKEYVIPESGVVIGRDAGSDVVVAQNDVSRKHAEVVPIDSGYALRDLSANGVFVNGARVDRTQLLARADVIRVGSEEFRFYADVAPTPVASRPATEPPPAPDLSRGDTAAPPSAPTPPMPAAAAPAVPTAPPTVTSVTPESVPALALTQAGRPAAQLPPVLAVLEVTSEGPTKGHLYSVHVPLAHIGRGAHNDVVIADDSVSDSHAKLQQRDDGWYLVDIGSTNGTYVSGQRLVSERRLDGAPDVRFGGVKMVFRSLETGTNRAAGGTRPIASIDRPPPRTAAPVAASAPEPEAPAKLPVWLWLTVLIIVAAVVAYFMMKY